MISSQTSLSKIISDPAAGTPAVPKTYETYSKASITSLTDFEIREELDQADKLIKADPRQALAQFETLLESREASSPRAVYGKARALDQLSERERSNEYLEQAIQTFLAVLDLSLIHI